MSNMAVACRGVVVGLLIALPNAAQITMSVSAPVQGSVDGTVLPVGPVTLPLSLSGGGFYGGSASMFVDDQFPGQAVPAAFSIGCAASASAFAWPIDPFGGSSGYSSNTGNLAATLRFTFTSPTAVTGALLLHLSQGYTSSSWGGSTTYGSALTRIDVGADGTFEHTFASPTVDSLMIPVSFQSSLQVDVVLDLSQTATAQSTPWTSASASGMAQLSLTGELRDDFAVVHPHSALGASAALDFTHHTNGDLDLEVQDLAGTPMAGLIVVGLQSVAIPLGPTVTQLVSADSVLLGGQASVSLPLLPPGTELYVQGFGIDTSGGWRGTGSLRALWL